MRLSAMAGLLLIALGCPAQGQQPAASGKQTITVPAGATVPLTLTTPLSTRTARPGDPVRAETTFPVTVGTTVAIPNGTYAEGALDKVTPRGSHAGFEMHFTRLIFANGYTVDLPGATAVTSALRPLRPGHVCGPAPQALMPLQTPTLPPLPAVGPNKGLIIGLVASGVAVAVMVAILAGHRSGGVYLDAGAKLDMVLQSPLSLDPDRIAVGAGGP